MNLYPDFVTCLTFSQHHIGAVAICLTIPTIRICCNFLRTIHHDVGNTRLPTLGLKRHSEEVEAVNWTLEFTTGRIIGFSYVGQHHREWDCRAGGICSVPTSSHGCCEHMHCILGYK